MPKSKMSGYIDYIDNNTNIESNPSKIKTQYVAVLTQPIVVLSFLGILALSGGLGVLFTSPCGSLDFRANPLELALTKGDCKIQLPN